MKTFLFTVILCVLMFTPGCDSGAGIYKGSYSTKHQGATVKGTSVASANKINTALFPSIDAGLDNAFRIARQYGYSQALFHNFYTVALFPRSPKCENPAFLVAADGSDWDGTDYDKDPRDHYVRLCAAGLTHSDRSMVVADDPGHMFNIVWFEAEHLLLKQNDYQKWLSTVGVHAHPILPDKEPQLTNRVLPLGWAHGEAVVGGQKIHITAVK